MLSELKIRSLFHTFNGLYFNNELPEPKFIEFNYVKRFIGQFQNYGAYKNNGYCVIRFSTAWTLTTLEVEKTLIHEMIHEWQWVNNHRLGHGMSFKWYAQKINNVTNNKYEIARCTALENSVCKKDANKRDFKGCLVVYEKTDYPDDIIVACCNVSKVNNFKRWFNVLRIKNLKYVRYYLAEGKILNDYRKSVVRMNGYRIPKKDFKKTFEKVIIREL
jgi:hypothetical protein